MNRGNLAEDPKAGLTSSSRYARDTEESNSLLYVGRSTLRKERKAAAVKSRAENTLKGDHNSNQKKSVGHRLKASHMNRLEVGSDGRLFHVRENISSDNENIPKTGKKSAAVKAGLPLNKEETANSTGTESGLSLKKEEPSKSAGTESGLSLNKEETANSTGTESGLSLNKEESANSAGSAIGLPLNKQRPAMSRSVMSEPRRSWISQSSNPLLADHFRKEESHGQAVLPAIHLPWKSLSDSRPLRLGKIAAAAILTLAAAGYGFAAWHFSGHFYPGTVILGIDGSNYTAEQMKAAVKAAVDSYSLELIVREPENQDNIDASTYIDMYSGNIITAEDIAMVCKDYDRVDRILKNQKSWAWPVMLVSGLIHNNDTELGISYDSKLVPEMLGKLPCMQEESMIRPQDAKVVLTKDGAQVQAEVYGTTLDPEKTKKAVFDAIDAGETQIDLDKEGLYITPSVYSSDLSLMADAMEMNKVLGANITLSIGGRTETIDSEVIGGFLDKSGSAYSLNEEKLRSYVSDLAEKYDTYQISRTFRTSIGTEVALEEGIGDYGWEIDQDLTYEKILEAILQQKETKVDAEYKREAFHGGADDIGSTYVEVNLTAQMLWFYKDGVLVVKSPVVTGNPYAGHETPSGGVWALKGKYRNQLLTGENYSSPVDYWMPFNGGIGLHDMQTRAWFGGSIYMGSGSHGCVNMPLSAVKLIYEQAQAGMPVIVYKDESEEAMESLTGMVDVQSLNAEIEATYGTVDDDGEGSIVSWTAWQRTHSQANTTTATTAN